MSKSLLSQAEFLPQGAMNQEDFIEWRTSLSGGIAQAFHRHLPSKNKPDGTLQKSGFEEPCGEQQKNNKNRIKGYVVFLEMYHTP